MDASLTVGQLEQLGAGVVCALPAGEIRKSAVDPLARAIGDRDIAASVVLERLVLQQEVELDARAVLAAELAFVDDHFRGSVAGVSGRAPADPADAGRRARAAARRAPARCRPGPLLLARGPRAPRSRTSTAPTPACGRASSRRRARSPGSAASRGGSRSRPSRRRASSTWRGTGRVRTHPRPDPRHAARRHGLSRHGPAAGRARRDRVVAEPLRARRRLRELAREGGGAGAGRGDLPRRPPADARRR